MGRQPLSVLSWAQAGTALEHKTTFYFPAHPNTKATIVSCTIQKDRGQGEAFPLVAVMLTLLLRLILATPQQLLSPSPRAMQSPHQEFMDLLLEHQHLLHKVCRAYCPHPEDQRDLFQDIALHLWRAYPSFRHEAKWSTWMYRIALNVALSQTRRSRPVIESFHPDRHHLVACPDSRHEVEHIYEAIQTLTDVEKAFLLLFLEDHTTEEIAHLLGITPNHVRVKMHRIREKLKTRMNAL